MWTQDNQLCGKLHQFPILQKNNEGTAVIPTQKSATASETTKALVLVRSCRFLQTREIINPFPIMVRIERNQPRIQNQASMFVFNHNALNQYLVWNVWNCGIDCIQEKETGVVSSRLYLQDNSFRSMTASPCSNIQGAIVKKAPTKFYAVTISMATT